MSLLKRGKLIRNCVDPRTLAYFAENGMGVADLYKRFRFEWVLGRDGKPLNIPDKEWNIIGSKGHLWEYGKGLLGISIEGSKWTPAFIRQVKSFCRVTQGGDGEANLKCSWTSENVKRLAKLLKLLKAPKLMSEHRKTALMANLKLSKPQPEALAEVQDALRGADHAQP